MADVRAVAVVVLILLSALAVGALAGYRMVLHDDWVEDAEPVTANLTLEFPDGSVFNATVTVDGARANALGILETVAPGNFTVGVRETSFGVYVHTIGAYRAEGSCGWMYSVGAKGASFQPDHAADRERIAEGDHVFWYWGCL